MRMPALLAALGSAALLAACTTPAYVSPVEVTRFTAAEPQLLGSGTISLRAAPGEAPDSWDYAAYQTAVADELTQLGYTVTGGRPGQLA